MCPIRASKLVEVDDRLIVLFHAAGQFYAIDDVCTHDGGPLGEGELDGFTIACPRHGAKFDIRDGRALTMPATQPTGAHEVKVEGPGRVGETRRVRSTTMAVTEDAVREALKQVIDPELFVNIIDLGLIYLVELQEADDKTNVTIEMTMTSPACPAGPQLVSQAKAAVGALEGVGEVEVKLVMIPPWTPDRMTEDARDQLGIF